MTQSADATHSMVLRKSTGQVEGTSADTQAQPA
eukprot:CAMPEP_0181181954 /NCGR_PEP_ID=MMETSP1096-20121128/7621_1 /TAXON_ID=156174 ORGANISM="Chrysochromulina ericina, Strain CCMP281" /NCGR_SAMPLE_ID=MMETSP1096 /ASSEMBLY_ACC=CAM_ASM_000453 /LENGTH=32 /DNA_ID= /DNA_START= /DNA_END= /DNA_ORIENTATION=